MSVFPSNCCAWWALKSWKWLNFCLLTWSSELNACFSLLEHATFTILINLSLFMTHKFSPCYPSSSLPHPAGGEWTTEYLVLSCLQGLSHQNYAGPSPTKTLCMFLKSVLLSYPTEMNHIIEYSYKICRTVTFCHRHSQEVPVKAELGSGKTVICVILFIMYYQINNSLRPDVDNRFLNTYWSGLTYHCAVSDSA